MLRKIFSFSNATLLVALTLSTIAAWYSIIGLTAIFAGAVIPIIIMGSALELAKITTTVWLRKYWHQANWYLKIYLVPAVILLALLTSMGIFGFLSKAHLDQGITSGDSQAKLALYDEKIKTQKDNVEVARKALTQMDAQVDQMLGRTDSDKGAERAVQIRRQQAKERTALQNDIAVAQKEIQKLNEERAPIAAENRKVEAEVGPIKYIAALIYGDNADENTLEAAVRWVIILLVVVFDPLALMLVLAANQSKEWDVATKEEPAYEPDDGPLTEEQIDQIKSTVKLPEESDPTLDPCYKCGTTLMNAPGIGPFCPNKECDVIDGPFEEETIEEPKSLLEQHPYLTQGFSHFKDLTPMVAKKEETVQEVEEVVEEVEPVKELTVDSTEPINIETEGVTQPKPYKELEGGYVVYDGKHMTKEVLHGMHPELFKLTADSGRSVNTNFGTSFPALAEKGDTFVRVDVLPNRVYKFDGKRWIEINKQVSDTYLHDAEYIKYLIQMIDRGEYDLELLSDKEKQEIQDHLTRNR